MTFHWCDEYADWLPTRMAQIRVFLVGPCPSCGYFRWNDERPAP